MSKHGKGKAWGQRERRSCRGELGNYALTPWM